MTSAVVAEAAHAAQDPSADLVVEVHLVVGAHVEAVHSLMVEVHTEAVRSLVVEVHAEAVRSLTAEAVLTDMEAWVAVAKLRAPACAPQHSSCVAPRS